MPIKMRAICFAPHLPHLSGDLVAKRIIHFVELGGDTHMIPLFFGNQRTPDKDWRLSQ